MEYLEKMIPHADRNFFGLEINLKGRIWGFRAKGKKRGREGERKREKMV